MLVKPSQSLRRLDQHPPQFRIAGLDQTSLITASRRQELRIGAAEGVAEKVEGLHGTLLAAP
jgi:hypothetical protein